MTNREIDALVEKHVFGVEVQWEQPDVLLPGPPDHNGRYFTESIADAWEMEEQIKRNGWEAAYVGHLMTDVAPKLRSPREIEEAGIDIFALVHATPEERCLAALKACGVEV